MASKILIFGDNTNGNSSIASLSPEMVNFLINWRKAFEYINRYTIIPIVLINIIANLINVLVFIRPSFKKVSIGFYLATLSIANIIASFDLMVQYTQFAIIGVQIFPTRGYFQILLYFQTTLTLYSPWLTVFVTLDRCLSTLSIKMIKILKDHKLQFAFLFSLIMIFNFFI